METISNIAGAASNAIWGGKGDNEEPVSGQQGAGTATDPYDKGNEVKTGVDTEPKIPGTTTSNVTSTSPEHNIAPSSGIDTTTNRSGPSNAQSGDTTGDPKSGQQPSAAQQGADKPTAIPTDDKGKPAMPHTDSQREALVNSGEFPHDPNDHSGEPLKMHDGADKKEDKEADPRDAAKKDRSASVAQEGGDPHGGNKGTGEQYVKTTGLAADGGDFDATKPGAGAEATRLQEEKGIKKEKPADATHPTTSTDSAGSSEKVKSGSKLQRLKEKLNLGTGKNLHG